MDNESIYNKIRDVFGKLPDNYNVLEEQIDINLQMEYFDFSKRVKKNFKPEVKIEAEEKKKLFQHDVDQHTKKQVLVKLASVEDIEGYRTIEKFLENPDDGLREWAVLAFQESRMLLQSRLLDENQVFISTGLGGKGSKLRYFIVFILKDGEAFSETQKKVVNNEVEITLKEYDIEIEEVSFYDSFATILAVIPIDTSIKTIFKKAIKECN